MSASKNEIPYVSKLSLFETQKAITVIKTVFQNHLASKLNLIRVSAPLFVEVKSGLNDDLNGCERPVTFEVKSGAVASVVHSLAKWKRMALKKYQLNVDSGLFTDMNAIRRDEILGPLHSYYVDQWDWEKVIREEDRNLEFLKLVVLSIYECFKTTESKINQLYPVLSNKLPETITFVSSQEMADAYPDTPPKDRETLFTRKHGAVFVSQVGKALKSGEIHDGRAPDYDDWDLNGDILVHHPTLDIAFELSSMGIRVSKESLLKQLKARGAEDRLKYPFHKALINGELPFSIGGGIGQSRLCMFLLEKVHIGEVQASVWDEQTMADCEQKNITLL